MRREAAGLALSAFLAGCVPGAPEDGLAPPPPDAPASLAEEGATLAAGDAIAAPAPRRGLLALLRKPPRADVPEVAAEASDAAAPDPAAAGALPSIAAATGEPLPFGEVRVACGVKGKALGTEVARYPSKGAGKWRLYDSDTSNSGPRTHYVTGFKDGCPRQVTAALGVFGGAVMHETLRYGSGRRTYSATDTAYEALKAPTCGTGPGTPCPEGR